MFKNARRVAARAFTLAEVIWVLAILAIMLSITLGLYVEGERHYAKTSVDLDAEREARAAMGYTLGNLRQAMPIYGGADTPVVAPTAWPLGASPSPTSSITFYKINQNSGIGVAVTGTTIYPNELQYSCVTIATTPAPTPAATGFPTSPPLLQETIYDPTCTTVQQQLIIGHDVQTFNVTPLSASAYDVQITTAPVIREDLQNAANTYTLTSTAFISYYQTNI
ncbi:MAG TPA: prepilin-type N-terminal cleavage/methylation domain-containing protein [Candidatus Eremiobacteraceae bacterium]|nr:prepilin-type N-terminal cleavage/methylation domain-containing protein [Candidatus Eremiobacteraceae bacterium]